MENVSGKFGPRMHWYFLSMRCPWFCLCLECEYFKHSSQFKINLSSWSFKLGQYTVSLFLSLHLPRPKCLSCRSWSEVWHFLFGTPIWVPFKTVPSSMVSSSLKVQWGCISLGTSLMVLGHPCIMVHLSSASTSSCWVDILIWFMLSFLVLNRLVIWWICSLGSLMVSFCPPSWNKQSASWLVLPGIYFTVKWYAKVLMSILCNPGSCLINTLRYYSFKQVSG